MSNFKSHVTRRAFLRGTAAAAASPLIRRQDEPVALDGVQPLKVGLIGCGGRGTGAAMQALSA